MNQKEKELADIIPGKLYNAVTLNRFAYANGNPVIYVDPTGLLVGAIIAGIGLLGALAIGLTSSSKQEEASTEVTHPPEEPSTPNITSAEQALHLYNSGLITADEVPPEYLWRIGIKNQQYANEENASNKTSTTETQSPDELEQIFIKAKEEAVGQFNDSIIDWGASQMDKWAGFGDLIVPDRTPPSVYIGAASKAFSVAQTVNDIVGGAVNNYNAGEPWGKIGTDAALDVGSALVPIGVQAGTTWAVTKIGAAAGTAIAPGVGTAIGTVVGFFAGVAYEIWGKPALDDLFE